MGALCCHLVPINSSLLVLIVRGLNPPLTAPPQKKNISNQKLIFEENIFLTLMLINFLKCKSHHTISLHGNNWKHPPFVLKVNPNPFIVLRYLTTNYFINLFSNFLLTPCLILTSALSLFLSISTKHNTYLCASENMFPLPKIPFSPLTI